MGLTSAMPSMPFNSSDTEEFTENVKKSLSRLRGYDDLPESDELISAEGTKNVVRFIENGTSAEDSRPVHAEVTQIVSFVTLLDLMFRDCRTS